LVRAENAATLKSAATSLGSSNFFFVGQLSQNSVVATTVDTGVDKSPDAYLESWIQQVANAYQEDNSMSSQQVSGTLYSGQGIQQPGGGADTFASYIANMDSMYDSEDAMATRLTDYLAAGRPDNNYQGLNTSSLQSMSDAEVNGEIAYLRKDSADGLETDSALTAAFNAHTLTIEKATDVEGLDYEGTDWMSTTYSVLTGGSTQSYNQGFLNQVDDGKQHTLTNIGGIEVYLTW